MKVDIDKHTKILIMNMQFQKYKTSTCELILDILDLVKIKSNGLFFAYDTALWP